MLLKWLCAWQNCSKNLGSADFRAKFQRFQNRETWNFAQKLGLKPGGILSVTEIIFDPHFQSRDTVLRLAGAVGFREKMFFGNRTAFTLNLEKPHGGQVPVGGAVARPAAGTPSAVRDTFASHGSSDLTGLAKRTCQVLRLYVTRGEKSKGGCAPGYHYSAMLHSSRPLRVGGARAAPGTVQRHER